MIEIFKQKKKKRTSFVFFFSPWWNKIRPEEEKRAIDDWDDAVGVKQHLPSCLVCVAKKQVLHDERLWWLTDNNTKTSAPKKKKKPFLDFFSF